MRGYLFVTKVITPTGSQEGTQLGYDAGTSRVCYPYFKRKEQEELTIFR